MSEPQRMPMISLAMMVKNEEEMLPASLESIAPWVDEIIVVDTGSTDRTVEIAESFGAKVYHHPWQRHFSLHRNQSIGYCTGDWVFILDADEILEPGSGEVLRRAAAEARSDAVSAIVHSVYDHGRGQGANISNRLIRNNGRIHYEGRVHNLLVGHESTEAWPVYIFHKGYNLAAEAQGAKFERTSALLKEDIAENPTRPRPHHYLAASYLSRRLPAEALAEAEEAIRLAESQRDDDDLYIWSHYLAAAASAELGRKDDCGKWCLAALSRRPAFYDAHFLLTRLAVERSDWQAVFSHSQCYLELVARFHEDPGSFGQLVLNTARSEWYVHHYLGIALAETGREAEADESFERALAETPDPAYCLRLRGRFLASTKQYERSRDYLRRSLALNPEDREVLMDIAATWNRQGRLGEERRALEQLLLVSFHVKAAARLGEIMIAAGELAAGRRHVERVLEEEPENLEALINLGFCLRNAGEPQAAILPLERACALDPGSAVAQGNLAEALLAAGEARARAATERAVELAPGLESADLRLKLCGMCLAGGGTDALIHHCETLLRELGLSYDRSLETAQDLGMLFAEMGEALLGVRRTRAAAEAFGLAGELVPGLRREIAQVLRERGLFHDALEQLRASFASNPSKDTLLEMEDVYTQVGMNEAASLCQREAARLPGAEAVGA